MCKINEYPSTNSSITDNFYDSSRIDKTEKAPPPTTVFLYTEVVLLFQNTKLHFQKELILCPASHKSLMSVFYTYDSVHELAYVWKFVARLLFGVFRFPLGVSGQKRKIRNLWVSIVFQNSKLWVGSGKSRIYRMYSTLIPSQVTNWQLSSIVTCRRRNKSLSCFIFSTSQNSFMILVIHHEQVSVPVLPLRLLVLFHHIYICCKTPSLLF